MDINVFAYCVRRGVRFIIKINTEMEWKQENGLKSGLELWKRVSGSVNKYILTAIVLGSVSN